MDKLVIGCGYLGLRVARQWVDDGHRVLALTRSVERAGHFRSWGIEPLIGDVTDSTSLPPLDRPLATVLYAVGYDRTAGKAMRDVYVQGLTAALDWLGLLPRRLIYVSSTGVYGESAHDELMDEQTPCRPTREGGRVCLEAEQRLLDHPLGQRAVILRLAGIYGPGRVPRRDQLIAGTAIAADPQGHLNLIHVDDAVQAVLASEGLTRFPETLIIADGQPVQRAAYYAYLAGLSGAPQPTFTAPDDAARGAARTQKRLDNRRMQSLLKLQLRYPSYREGLAAVLDQEADGASDPGSK